MANQHWVDSDSYTPLLCNSHRESLESVISCGSIFDCLAYAAVTGNICSCLSETGWLSSQSAVTQPSQIATRCVLTTSEPPLARFRQSNHTAHLFFTKSFLVGLRGKDSTTVQALDGILPSGVVLTSRFPTFRH